MSDYTNRAAVKPMVPRPAMFIAELDLLAACGIDHTVHFREQGHLQTFLFASKGVTVFDPRRVDDPQDLAHHLEIRATQLTLSGNTPDWVEVALCELRQGDKRACTCVRDAEDYYRKVENLHLDVLRTILGRLDEQAFPYLDIEMALTADRADTDAYGGEIVRVYRDQFVRLSTHRIADNVEELATAAREILDCSDGEDCDEAHDMLEMAMERLVPGWRLVPSCQTTGPL